MSTSKAGASGTRIAVEAPDPFTEISVLDWTLSPMSLSESGENESFSEIGRCTLRVNPGVYVVRFVRGASSYEVPVVLDDQPGQLKLQLPDAPFDPAAAEKLNAQEGGAARVCNMDPIVLHEGDDCGELVVFVRDIHPGRRGNAAEGLSLHYYFNPLYTFDSEHGVLSSSREGWAGSKLRLRAGSYVLARGHKEKLVERRHVQVIAGRQTQVFLLATGAPEQPRKASFWRMTLAIGPIDSPLLRHSQERELVEAALTLLARTDVARVLHRAELLTNKFENALLHLLGTALYLRQEHLDAGLLRAIIDSLAGALGNIPDVIAIKAFVAHRHLVDVENWDTSNLTFSQPPMLLETWRLACEASSTFPGLIGISPAAVPYLDDALVGDAWLTFRSEQSTIASLFEQALRFEPDMQLDPETYALPGLYRGTEVITRDVDSFTMPPQRGARENLMGLTEWWEGIGGRIPATSTEKLSRLEQRILDFVAPERNPLIQTLAVHNLIDRSEAQLLGVDEAELARELCASPAQIARSIDSLKHKILGVKPTRRIVKKFDQGGSQNTPSAPA